MTTSVWMFSYRFEYAPGVYGPVLRWWRGQPLPQEVVAHIAAGGIVVAHNAAFERVMWNTVMPSQTGWGELLPLMTIRQMDCTMARARAIGLPADLERAAEVCEAPVKKDTKGAETMKKMAKHRSMVFSNAAAGHAYHAGAKAVCISDHLDESFYQIGEDPKDYMRVTWWWSEENGAILQSYCDDDVYAECGVDVVVPALSADERETWELDQKINDAGVMVDVPFVKKLIDVVEIAVRHADRRMWDLTGGQVQKCSEAAKLRDWLKSRGLEVLVPDGNGGVRATVAKGAIDDLVLASRARGDKDALDAIELRNAAAKSSTAKFTRALKTVCEDDRLKGQFIYHGAGPGRWTGAIVQLQNLVRIDEDRDLPTVRAVVEIVNNFDADDAVELIGVL